MCHPDQPRMTYIKCSATIREENEDVITHIDARQMSNRGICKEYENDFGAEYKVGFLKQIFKKI